VKRKFHLTHTLDFQRVKSKGQSVYHRLLILVYTQNELDISRTAVVTSKKVGNAVMRNRVRRRVWAVLADQWICIEPGWDLIFYSRSAISEADFPEIMKAIKHLLQKAGVIKNI
jgi:ribonuclease P protein component